jgi:CBS domain-containing protein
MVSPTIVAGVRASLGAHAPFSLMRDEDVEFAARRAELAYFAPGETVVAPEAGVPSACWIIRDGVVEGVRGDDESVATRVAELTPGDAFPVGALLADRAVTARYRAVGDVFCWTLAKADFDALIGRSPVFLDFCKRRLGAMLDLSQQQVQASYAQQVAQWRTMAAPLADLVRRPPVSVPPQATLREVFDRMERDRVGSVIVGDAEGIFTRQDVIGRVVLPGLPLDTPIERVMTSPLIALDAQATVAEAMLLMARRTIRHVPVVRDGHLIGVVTERDLFVMQRQSLRAIGDAIGLAGDVDGLARVAADIRAWSSALVAQGVAASFVTRLISRLNDQLTSRVIALEAGAAGVTVEHACWLALGSEGREEQTIATDQDNGLILPDGTAPAERDRMLAFADAVNRALDRCGYPLCKGAIMAGNPKWCLDLAGWRALFDGWIDRGDPESLLAANIFFDFRALHGNADLAAALREHVTARAAKNQRFLKQMSDNAQRSAPPASWTGGLLGQLFSSEEAMVDLKLNGTAPFVDGARLLALAHGVTATGTAERFEALAAAGVLPPVETQGWVDAFQFLQGLRLRVQHDNRDTAPENPNVIDTRTLSVIDRRILKESFREARKVQQRLAVDYPG